MSHWPSRSNEECSYGLHLQLCGMLLTMVAALSLIRTAYTMAAGDGQPPVDLTYDIVRTLTLVGYTQGCHLPFTCG